MSRTRKQTPSKRRRRSLRIEEQIQAKAGQRQRAWAEGDQAYLTARLSADLNGPEHLLRPEGLFADGRQEMAGEMEPGSPKTSGAFRS
jgi:hypothetical protein